tara:strand:+ start:9423 stop:10466 length:1044 start_codon:yes stop_codon:yes gene_type:complete
MEEILTRESDFDSPEVQQYLKLFSYDMADIYHYLDSKGYGDDFIQNLKENVYHGLMYLIDALQIQDHRNWAQEDKKLFHEHILEQWLNGYPKNFPHDSQKTGKIFVQFDKGDEAYFFNDLNNSRDIAEHVFGDYEEADHLDLLDRTPDIPDEDLINILSRENFTRMVLWFLKKYEGKVIQNWREEFHHWVEKDNIGDNSFYVTKDRMYEFLGMELESAKYNWLVLLTHLDGEVENDVNDMLEEMKWSWRDNYGAALEEEYSYDYKEAFEKFMGKLSFSDDYHRQYEATDFFERLFYIMTKDGIDPGTDSWEEFVIDNIGSIDPVEPNYPPDSTVEEYYNDYVKYLFK